MTRRLLPRADYGRLVGTYLEPIAHVLPDDTDVIVVEDDDGRIVGCWATFPVWHMEGVYIDPAYRKNGAVARRLLAGMRSALRTRGVRRACTAALTSDVEDMIRRIGGPPLPGQHFVVEM